jgi:hypothetical protein
LINLNEKEIGEIPATHIFFNVVVAVTDGKLDSVLGNEFFMVSSMEEEKSGFW